MEIKTISISFYNIKNIYIYFKLYVTTYSSINSTKHDFIISQN